MTAPGTRDRTAADACPGVSRPFAAADGAIVRVRPGGRPVPVDALAGLLDIVAAQPDPTLQLTSRAALQLRGLQDPLPSDVRRAITATGLVPSAAHELVRNVVASPLSGLDRFGHGDLRPVVRTLDAALCADAGLARLPGRFLFVVDDGRGDVVRESFDVGLLALDARRAAVLVGSPDRGFVVDLDGAAEAMVGVARRFLDVRTTVAPGAWHVREIVDHLEVSAIDLPLPREQARPVGAVGDHAVVAVPLGLLTRQHVDSLSRLADEVVVTPWRSLVVPGAATGLGRLEEAGFVVEPGSPWLRLHACTGAPGCQRTDVDTRGLARALAPALPPGTLPVHVSGCERRCGTPSSCFVDVLAPRSLADAVATVTRTTSPSPHPSEDR
ncbi:precorrin-3B synthase [Intrasporangium sp. YIM S08009]|uniref:precorrin-3B synthase n=1 Tax=Intrasporangium zincisolvens TaxID=3080018 RepID=UPI002B062048|nr:precorrin-3B synthase [Intrasporangium sp. YIM S08009]